VVIFLAERDVLKKAFCKREIRTMIWQERAEAGEIFPV
jgi:hypothetical protein